jgi:hypothetical protein
MRKLNVGIDQEFISNLTTAPKTRSPTACSTEEHPECFLPEAYMGLKRRVVLLAKFANSYRDQTDRFP